MHELPSPLSNQVPVGLEAAFAANELFDERALLAGGFYDQLHTKQEVSAAITANTASFDALVAAAGSLIGKQSLLAAEDIQTQQLFLAGSEAMAASHIALRSQVGQEAMQSDETLQQIAENRAAIRRGINEAFGPYIQAFLDKKPHPTKKPGRIARNKSYDWEVPSEQGGHRFTMHYREDSKGVHMTRVDCTTLPPTTAVDSYNNLNNDAPHPKVRGMALFPPYVVSCQFENGEPTELSLNWPPQMFKSTYLQQQGRIGNLIGRPHGNSTLRQPSTVLHTIGSKAEGIGTGRTQITLDLREGDPTVVLKKTPSDALTSNLVVKLLVGTAKDVEIGGYVYNPQSNIFEAPGMPYPDVPGKQFAALVADILRYIPTLREATDKTTQ
ncbi:MAG TPA: hypothetical protein VFI74_05215 [Candidatus Saccharimonadales bacterium]|nr:hypothetical protein [Candidatus Saccharimonadales bacterium]